ncbi:toxic anion resistance protein [Bacillus massiliigorillae]|uniref:toxic anion resistance protein n=1 Tax=Bacillus massiliigorillae TaxID=1243664 RepID=UPI00039A097F|nr:toxic anion resistance protein [Bacillus massiliigorillae]
MSENNPLQKSDVLDDLLSNPFGDDSSVSPVVEANYDATPKPKRLVDVLPQENRERAVQLAEQIDPTDFKAMMMYGTQAQTKLTSFSHAMLDQVQKKDIGEIGDILGDLMKRLESVRPDELGEKRGMISRFFGKIQSSIQETLSKYQKTSVQIDRIAVQLTHAKNGLLTDIGMLEQLYEKNKDYFHALNIYIAAAELKMAELNEKVIPELRRKAEATGDQMAVQEVNDMMQFMDRLEKRMHDLQLSRQITIQTAPQIRLIQNTNQTLAEKIQSSIMTAIPLWKNQVAIALALLRQQSAVNAQNQVAKTTNELLLKNSEMLKVNTIETAKANERGLVDIETLKKTQENLITALEETMRIQAEGRIKRQQAQIELTNMEEDLKHRLLNLKPKN